MITRRGTLYGRQPRGGVVADLLLRQPCARSFSTTIGGHLLAQLRRAAPRTSRPAPSAGWSSSTTSTSSGLIFSPPRLICSFSRPVRNRYPSSSSRPWSPVRNHPSVNAPALAVRVVVVPRRHVRPADHHLARSLPCGWIAPSLVHDCDLRPRRQPHASRACAPAAAAGCTPSGAPPPSSRTPPPPAPRTRPPAPPSPAAATTRTTTGSAAAPNRPRLLAGLSRTRIRIAWCIVGTAVYQLGRTAPTQSANLNALNPGVQHTPGPRAATTTAPPRSAHGYGTAA